MSEKIKHECGIAFVRLLKPLAYYQEKYGTSFYGLHKMQLLMEKQHNRGQDGAGIANVKFDLPPGNKYINRIRSNAASPIKDVFSQIFSQLDTATKENPRSVKDSDWLKQNVPFTGEVFLGHLRYGTYGGNKIGFLHPVMRQNNWKTRNLVCAGNFNLTNVDELFNQLLDIGQYPVETSDTVTILEKFGHFLDEANEDLYRRFKKEGYTKSEITDHIIESINVQDILRKSAKDWDGGYSIGGVFGHGDAFIMRDPAGIRPAFFYHDDEVVVAASERAVIQTAFNLKSDAVTELEPGKALIIKKSGIIELEQFHNALPKKPCSFERIYFSRGTDQDIYQERKKLGKLLTPAILNEIDYDIENCVFSHIPNTALDAFHGLSDGVNMYCNEQKTERILSLENHNPEKISKILNFTPRIEKVAVKDIKLRTFITEDSRRDDLVAHVYDVTYGVVKPNVDKLVVIDDSIVRGTTLKKSIIRILDRLGPTKIVIASSAPQIRYPDCYGIDMARLNDFVAFKAAISLLKETNQGHIIDEVYKKSKLQENLPKEEIKNYVKEIYKPFTPEQISNKITELLTPPDINAKISIIYQTIEQLHEAVPNHKGDWYFTGNYPTPGGNKVVNKAFLNYMEGSNERAY